MPGRGALIGNLAACVALFGVALVLYPEQLYSGRFLTRVPPCAQAYAVRDWFGPLIVIAHYAGGVVIGAALVSLSRVPWRRIRVRLRRIVRGRRGIYTRKMYDRYERERTTGLR